MSVREDRLWSEFKAMQKFRSQVINWEKGVNYDPPDVYRITYNLKSLIGFNSDGSPRYHTGFTVEVRFPPDYPRGKPDVRFVSDPRPYHPNIWHNDRRFCFDGNQQLYGESHWKPGIGVSLDSLCEMIGKVIAFQEVNLKSPANNDGKLKDWIEKSFRFETLVRVSNPIDPSPIRLPDLGDVIRFGDEPEEPRSRIRFG